MHPQYLRTTVYRLGTQGQHLRLGLDLAGIAKGSPLSYPFFQLVGFPRRH